MHPLWQLKQVITTGHLTNEQKAARQVEVFVRNVDCNNNFSGRGSYQVWWTVNGLITWVAINIKDIEDLGVYVDDDFGFEEAGLLEYYAPYNEFYPAKQVKLLPMTTSCMTTTMPSDSKAELMLALCHFTSSTYRNL